MASSEQPDTIDSLLTEGRLFPPPARFVERSRVPGMSEYRRLCQEAHDDPEGFWGRQAQALVWERPFTKVLSWEPPNARWFLGGAINASVNCLDRHLKTHRWNKTAIRWEGENRGIDGFEQRDITYDYLARKVGQLANLLTLVGIRPGDRVGIYLPLVPEIVISMLACARIGAVHTVVFGGFSTDALRDRLNDAQAKVLITADGTWRRGKLVPLKADSDKALEGCPTVERVFVVRRTGEEVPMRPRRDFWFDEMIADEAEVCAPYAADSEHPLFTLYTSGTTGKPKGILHTTAGYLLGATKTMEWVFDIRDEDVYWCTADCGWVTGHTYVVYGPLSVGASIVMYDGAPDTPDRDRFWDIVERHKVSILYTAPTAIRTFVKWGDSYPGRHDLTTLRLLGTVGEPINPEAWLWYHRTIGGERCPIVDTWWQTETGAIMISPLPGAVSTKPGSATLPLPGIVPEIVDAAGKPVPTGTGGFLVIRRPWPWMLRGVWGDPDRYVQQYWSRFPGVYLTGDAACQDADGYFWIMGRVDDVIKVAGHRLGTAEIESALVSHPKVAEAAVVARPDDIAGSAIVAFVILRELPDTIEGVPPGLGEELRGHVATTVGPVARPAEIRFTAALPKTRSGKIMRRLLRDVASGTKQMGDMTTVEDPGVLDRLRQEYGED